LAWIWEHPSPLVHHFGMGQLVQLYKKISPLNLHGRLKKSFAHAEKIAQNEN